jgi:hypothetical protein
MPARSTLGDQSDAVPSRAITWPKPKAAALRRMAPTLPASCTRSRTTLAASPRIAGDAGKGTTKATGAGVSSEPSSAIAASATTTVAAAASASGR